MLRRSDPWGLGRSTVETKDFGSEDPETRGFCLGSFGFGRPIAAGTLGGELKRIIRRVDFYGVVHGITFAGFRRRSGGLAPQATNPCKRDRDCLEYKAVALQSSGIVDSEDGCRFSFGNANTRETWSEIQLKIAEDDRSRDRSAILSTQVRLTRRKQTASHATHLPKTSTWAQLTNFTESHNYLLSSHPFTSEAKIEVDDWGMWCSAQVRLRMDHEGDSISLCEISPGIGWQADYM